MEMNYIQQEIITHKNKLITLVNNLINTQIINEEIFINNEIKTESEFLNSLLNIKQNRLMNQLNQNNNSVNTFNYQNNQMMNLSPINRNPIQVDNQQIIPNNMNVFNNNNNIGNNNILYNIKFIDDIRHITMLHCRPSEIFSDIIEKYRKKSNDDNNNYFLYNDKNIKEFLDSTLEEQGIYGQCEIKVCRIGGGLIGGQLYIYL